eukprot:gene930-1806_t
MRTTMTPIQFSLIRHKDDDKIDVAYLPYKKYLRLMAIRIQTFLPAFKHYMTAEHVIQNIEHQVFTKRFWNSITSSKHFGYMLEPRQWYSGNAKRGISRIHTRPRQRLTKSVRRGPYLIIIRVGPLHSQAALINWYPRNWYHTGLRRRSPITGSVNLSQRPYLKGNPHRPYCTLYDVVISSLLKGHIQPIVDSCAIIISSITSVTGLITWGSYGENWKHFQESLHMMGNAVRTADKIAMDTKATETRGEEDG